MTRMSQLLKHNAYSNSFKREKRSMLGDGKVIIKYQSQMLGNLMGDMSTDPMTNILMVAILKGKCPPLRSSKWQDPNPLENHTQYTFDILKVSQIFYHLLKYKHIRLLDDHGIPLVEETKVKMYCKCHNSYNHSMTHYIIL